MKKNIKLICLLLLSVFGMSGCGLLKTAISAGIGYGIYQATKK